MPSWLSCKSEECGILLSLGVRFFLEPPAIHSMPMSELNPLGSLNPMYPQICSTAALKGHSYSATQALRFQALGFGFRV